jgi:hypothetical protein
VVLDYSSWTAEQILKSVFPPSITEVTTAFEAIGHIAHMNLRDEQLPFKNLIGQVCGDGGEDDDDDDDEEEEEDDDDDYGVKLTMRQKK